MKIKMLAAFFAVISCMANATGWASKKEVDYIPLPSIHVIDKEVGSMELDSAVAIDYEDWSLFLECSYSKNPFAAMVKWSQQGYLAVCSLSAIDFENEHIDYRIIEDNQKWFMVDVSKYVHQTPFEMTLLKIDEVNKTQQKIEYTLDTDLASYQDGVLTAAYVDLVTKFLVIITMLTGAAYGFYWIITRKVKPMITRVNGHVVEKVQQRKVALEQSRVRKIVEDEAIRHSIRGEANSADMQALREKIASAIQAGNTKEAEHLIELAERLSKLK